VKETNPVTRRSALRAGAFGAGLTGAAFLDLPPAVAASRSAATGSPGSTGSTGSTGAVFDVMDYGAVGDGATDDTAAIQAALNAAGGVAGSEVIFPPAPGGCYRVSGVTVPGGVGNLVGQSSLNSADAPTTATLTGSVLAPADTAVTTLLTVGASGGGALVPGNPHGLTIYGLGFAGTEPGGTAVAGMWGVTVLDTSAVTLSNCRDLYCGAPGFSGYPSGGDAAGGFARFLSSGTGNAFSVNGRLLFCCSYGAGNFLVADGLSAALPGGGSTDGRVVGCQVNGHNRGAVFGPQHAGTGGWGVSQCHFSSAEGQSHISYGPAGNPWTLRLEDCYLDLCAGPAVDCQGRGLQAVGNYIRSLANPSAIEFDAALSVAGRDPAAVLVGNTFDLNGSTTAVCFAVFDGFTAADFAAHGGGEFRGNLVHNHGNAMPATWVAPYIGSDSVAVDVTAIGTASSARLDLVQKPVLSS
jgi:hypothetical protein